MRVKVAKLFIFGFWLKGKIDCCPYTFWFHLYVVNEIYSGICFTLMCVCVEVFVEN